VDNESVHALLRDTSGRAEYKYPNGELLIVNVDRQGWASNDTLHESLASFRKVLNIHAEMWSKAYRYPVSNGVRQVAMHLTIAGHQVLLLYEGQPATCYGCGKIGHLYQACPARQATGTEARLT
jgi:hypothetical protein